MYREHVCGRRFKAEASGEKQSMCDQAAVAQAENDLELNKTKQGHRILQPIH